MVLVLTTSYGGECVGRNRKKITIQLNKRIDALLRIGEKKVKVGGRVVDGIHSVKTADSYRGTSQRLSLVCKGLGVRNIEDIDKSVIERYMEDYCNASAWTVSRELSATNKILGTSYTPSDLASRNAVHTPRSKTIDRMFYQSQALHTEQKIKMGCTLLLLLAAVARLSQQRRLMTL